MNTPTPTLDPGSRPDTAPLKILFVDDEPAVLEGLENRLRPLRSRWQMHFASSGNAALELMATQPIDVIVSDSRMPGMDGAALLQTVRERHPRVARMMLSGQPSQDNVLRALPIAHQFLPKPCEPSLLEEAVEHAVAMQSRLHNPAVIRVIGNLRTLPALPRLYLQLTQELDNPNSSSASVAKIIQQDVGMTARVLQLANSAFYKLPRPIIHVRDAVTHLGVQTLQSVALSVGIFQSISSASLPKGFSLENFWQHSQQTALAASTLLGPSDARKTAFSAGMLHDIGDLIVAMSMATEWTEIQRRCQDGTQSKIEIEQEILGCTHAEVGAHLLALWGLPNNIVEAVVYHHQPSRASETRFGVIGAVHVGNFIAHAMSLGDSSKARHLLDSEYLQRTGSQTMAEGWLAASDPAPAARATG